MKVSISELKNYLPKLSWSAEELATRLSIIGHETELIDRATLNISLTSNRKDCQQIAYLAFDVAAIYPELGLSQRVSYRPGKKIAVTLEKINKLLGSSVTVEQYQQLERLGFAVKEDQVIPPDFRQDISEGADIAEEVFRLFGAAIVKIEPLSKQPAVESADFQYQNQIRYLLAEAGATETKSISFSWTGKVKLKNPFSATEPYLRETLADGLLQTLSRNPYSRKNIYFEIGNVFKPEEKAHLGIIITGHKLLEDVTDKINAVLGVKLQYLAVDQHLLTRFSVKQPNVVVAEIPIIELKLAKPTTNYLGRLPQYQPVSQYPPLVRDISVSLEQSEKEFVEQLHEAFKNILFVEKIDSYRHPQTNKTTETFRIIFQKMDSSFTQAEINQVDGQLAAFQ